jgi:hypothetical protein
MDGGRLPHFGADVPRRIDSNLTPFLFLSQKHGRLDARFFSTGRKEILHPFHLRSKAVPFGPSRRNLPSAPPMTIEDKSARLPSGRDLSKPLEEGRRSLFRPSNPVTSGVLCATHSSPESLSLGFRFATSILVSAGAVSCWPCQESCVWIEFSKLDSVRPPLSSKG